MKFGLVVPYKMAQSKWQGQHSSDPSAWNYIHASTVELHDMCIVPVTELQGTAINVVAGRSRLIQVRIIQIDGTPAYPECKFFR